HIPGSARPARPAGRAVPVLHECHHVAARAATIRHSGDNPLRAATVRRIMTAAGAPRAPGIAAAGYYGRRMASGSEHLSPGLADRIELRLGPALDTLRALPAGESFDLAFIDADKTGYAGYWEEIVPRVRPGGLILVDNTLLHGRIFLPEPDPDALAIRQFNELALADD